jgi:hypothetical protein
MLLCNIEARMESKGLVNWHVACCTKRVKHKQRALCGGALGQSDVRMALAGMQA